MLFKIFLCSSLNFLLFIVNLELQTASAIISFGFFLADESLKFTLQFLDKNKFFSAIFMYIRSFILELYSSASIIDLSSLIFKFLLTAAITFNSIGSAFSKESFSNKFTIPSAIMFKYSNLSSLKSSNSLLEKTTTCAGIALTFCIISIAILADNF